jgi:hypothetical protein
MIPMDGCAKLGKISRQLQTEQVSVPAQMTALRWLEQVGQANQMRSSWLENWQQVVKKYMEVQFHTP